LRIQTVIMGRPILIAVLTLGLVGTAAAGGIARECKKGACRKAINLCVKQSCAQFSGVIKDGCKKAARLTLRNACTVVPDHAAFCADIASQGCVPG
jgi:hypothetical protein